MAYVMAAVPQASVAVAATGLGDVPHMIAYLSELFTLKPGGSSTPVHRLAWGRSSVATSCAVVWTRWAK